MTPSDKRAAEALERIKERHAETEAFLADRGASSPECHVDRGWLLTEREMLLSALREAEKSLAVVDGWWFDPSSRKRGACSNCEANLHENCQGKHQQLNGDPCPIQTAHDSLAAIRKAMEGEPDPEKRPQEPRR